MEAYGKHLLHHVDDAPTLHVHLGMRGLLLRYDDPAVPPRKGVRLRLAAPDDERWVYKRQDCHRCGAPVRTWQLGGRTAYACPMDQPRS